MTAITAVAAASRPSTPPRVRRLSSTPRIDVAEAMVSTGTRLRPSKAIASGRV
ncbi:MAG: hypothetical protein JRH11_07960 [Deltaproteobacteria bacterium]|nr:hypothetical protein [Deltaproteobacteria bacterium]